MWECVLVCLSLLALRLVICRGCTLPQAPATLDGYCFYKSSLKMIAFIASVAMDVCWSTIQKLFYASFYFNFTLVQGKCPLLCLSAVVTLQLKYIINGIQEESFIIQSNRIVNNRTLTKSFSVIVLYSMFADNSFTSGLDCSIFTLNRVI